MFAMWPSGCRPARAGQFRRARWRSWPGKGRRRVRGSPRTQLRVGSGRGGRRQGCAAAAAGAGTVGPARWAARREERHTGELR
jgi:hypothetical protein